MDQQSSDVKTEAASSATSDVNSGAASSAAEQAQTQTKTDVKPFDPHAIADKIFDKHVKANEADSSSTEEGEGKEESVSKKDTDQAEESSEEVVEDKEDSKDETQTKPEHEDAIPYKRFEEVNTKLKSLEQEVEKTYRPKAEVYDQWVGRMTEGNVPEADFKAAVDVLCLIQSDPAKAREALRPIWEGLNTLTGDSLPADLQAEVSKLDQEVEDGTMTKERADWAKGSIREMAKLRGQTKISATKSQQTEQQRTMESQRNAIAQATTSLGSWIKSKQASDPDFQQTGKKYAYFSRIYSAELTTKFGGQIPSPQQTIALAEEVAKEVNDTFKSMLPKGKSNVGLSSTKSSTTQAAKPKDLNDAVERRMKARGHKFV